MHRWCPNGQLGGPCAEHGRHGSPSSSTTRSRGPRGPNPNDGAVDPKIATVGVPTACAKCNGALSFVTRTAARRIASASAEAVMSKCDALQTSRPFRTRIACGD